MGPNLRHSFWSGVATWLATACCPQCPPCLGTNPISDTAASKPAVGVSASKPSGTLASSAPSGSGGETSPNCVNDAGQLFPPAAAWNTAVSAAPLDRRSAAIVAYLARAHTAKTRFQIDFSFNVLTADASAPRRPFTRTASFYQPDCDFVPVPLPPGGALEGETGYACTKGSDCHLIVVDRSQCRLWEMWEADLKDDTLHGGCLAVWDLARVYPPSGRGDFCTSADAAGLPIAPLLFTPDEVAKGQIRHALRLILPNKLIRSRALVRPATHATSATQGPADTPPYGARFRLQATKDLGGLKPAARVVARALQTYGMILVDGGNITFTAASDAFTTNKWSTLGMGPHDLKELAWSDFELVDSGPVLAYTGDCTRAPTTR
jgi:hypothetical protein